MVPLWFFYDSSMVPLWFLSIHLKLKEGFSSFWASVKGQRVIPACTAESKNHPCTLLRYLSSILAARQTLPPSPSSEANMGKNSYLPPSLLPLPQSSGYSLFLVSEQYVKFFCTLSYFTHTPPGLHLCLVKKALSVLKSRLFRSSW